MVSADQQRIVACIYDAIEQVNATRAVDASITPALGTVLVSDHDGLDSLGLINFVVALEDQLLQVFGRQIAMADMALDPSKRPHFATVADLATYIDTIVSKG